MSVSPTGEENSYTSLVKSSSFAKRKSASLLAFAHTPEKRSIKKSVLQGHSALICSNFLVV